MKLGKIPNKLPVSMHVLPANLGFKLCLSIFWEPSREPNAQWGSAGCWGHFPSLIPQWGEMQGRLSSHLLSPLFVSLYGMVIWGLFHTSVA